MQPLKPSDSLAADDSVAVGGVAALLPLSWIRTALYFAREENKLSIINQINYNMPKPYYEG